MPVPTKLFRRIGRSTITIRVDGRGATEVPAFHVRGYAGGRPADVAHAVLDSGSGRWDITLPSGRSYRGWLTSEAIETRTAGGDRAFWAAVRRVADRLAEDVVEDALQYAHVSAL